MGPQEKRRDLGVGAMTRGGDSTEGRPILVMIHGAGGRSRIWQNQTRILGESMNALALDLPGHGNTGGEGHSTISGYSRWLKDALEAISPHPAFLMGHSMGGAIALETAITYPKILKGIILVATGPRLRVSPEFLQGLLNHFDRTVDTIMAHAYGPGVDPSVIEEGRKIMKGAGARLVHGDFLACDLFNRVSDLHSVELPCLILSGGEDKLTPPRLSQTLKEGIGGSTLKVFPGAGHMLMIERYRELNEAVSEFILGAPQ